MPFSDDTPRLNLDDLRETRRAPRGRPAVRVPRDAPRDLYGVKARNRAPERSVHVQIVRHLRELRRLGFIHPDADIFASLSEAVGKAGAVAGLTPAQLAKVRHVLIGMGLGSGLPDIILTAPAPEGGFTFMGGFEVKAAGGSLSEAQRERLPQLQRCGWRIAVVGSLGEAEEAARDWPIWRRGLSRT